MKTVTRLFTLLVILSSLAFSGQAQTRMLWDDQQDLISNAGETILISKLAADGIEVVMNLEYKKRCEYVYAELTGEMNKAVLTIYDCNRKVLGTKTWLSKFFSITEEEQIALLNYAIVEILDNPVPDDSRKTEDQDEYRFTNDEFTVPFNHHSSRYFFSPSSYNLRRGELYFSTLYFATYDLQYGINDKFSIGMGTTIVGLNPFYITPKYSFQIKENHAVAIGSLFFVGTWGLDFFGNLGYGTYTYGNQFKNITLGLGYLYVGGGDIETKQNKLVVNLSGMARMSDYLYFVSENYFVGFDEEATGYYGTNPSNGEYDYMENFDVHNNIIAGMSGFRFITKNRNVGSWQFGLTYVIRMRGWMDPKYDSDKWFVEYNTGNWNRFIIPTISYVSKLGKRV